MLDGPFAYSEPRSGWTGTIGPSAFLYAPDSSSAVLSGTTAALGSWGGGHGCPCSGQVLLFTRPADRWSGTLISDSRLVLQTLDGPLQLAMQDQQLFLSGTTEVDVYNLSGVFSHVVARPSIRRASVTGLVSGKPELRIVVASVPGARPLRTITIHLPAGLRFTGDHHRVLGHLTVTPRRGDVRVRLVGRSLRLMFPASQVITVGVRAPAIIETQALRRAAERAASHRADIRLQLHVGNRIGDTTKTIIVSPRR